MNKNFVKYVFPFFSYFICVSCTTNFEDAYPASIAKLDHREFIIMEVYDAMEGVEGSIKFTSTTVKVLPNGAEISLKDDEMDALENYFSKIHKFEGREQCLADRYWQIDIKKYKGTFVQNRWRRMLTPDWCVFNEFAAAAVLRGKHNDMNTPFWREDRWGLPPEK